MCLFLPNFSTTDMNRKPQGHCVLYVLWIHFPHSFGSRNVCSGCVWDGDFLINFSFNEKECVILNMVLGEAAADAITEHL